MSLPRAPLLAPNDLVDSLRSENLISAAARLVPLTGGVSSEIYLVEDGARRFVVKRALAKLKVQDDWYANTARSRTEEAFLRYVSTVLPPAVPRLIASDPNGEWFAMEYFGEGFVTWKSRLMNRDVDLADAQRAGETLGTIHRVSWNNPAIAAAFATDDNFHQLRIEPYFKTAAHRLPEFASLLLTEASRLQSTKLALVHGDFSPKNLLTHTDRLVILDAEVAWFGDPAFDTAFLLTHLLLKALLHRDAPDSFLESASTFWKTYAGALGPHANGFLEERTVRLVLCLLLARVQGKSPVEYLSHPKHAREILAFVEIFKMAAPTQLNELIAAWRANLLSQ